MRLLSSDRRRPGTAVLLSATVLACVVSVAKAEGNGEKRLYQWTDEFGETHFSDKPPPEEVPGEQLRSMQSAQPPASDSPGDDYYSVENQASRMEDDRREREAERGEAKKREAERAAQKSELEAASSVPEQMQDDGQPVLERPVYPIVPPQQLPRPEVETLPVHIGRPGGNIPR